jgi:hypothetical protein
MVKKAYKILWNASVEILEEFIMNIMLEIDDASPRELRIVEVEEHRESNQMSIEKLIEASREVLNEYMMKPVKLITLAKIFIQITKK